MDDQRLLQLFLKHAKQAEQSKEVGLLGFESFQAAAKELIDDEQRCSLEKSRSVTLECVRAQREELMRAVIAAGNFDPLELVQVQKQSPDGTIWYLRRKTETELAECNRAPGTYRRVQICVEEDGEVHAEFVPPEIFLRVRRFRKTGGGEVWIENYDFFQADEERPETMKGESYAVRLVKGAGDDPPYHIEE